MLYTGFALKSNGAALASNVSTQSSKASMVLGILTIVFATIAFFLVLAVQRLTTNFEITRFWLVILLITISGILSIIGFIFGLTNKVKSGSKIAGIVLNTNLLVLCIIMFMIIQEL